MNGAAATAGEGIASPSRVAAALAALGAVAIAAALVLLFASVEVTGAGTSRSCGSAFDGAIDRSGWELWWAHDLAEPDDEVRELLLRTTECPGAVNRRLAISGIVGALGASSAVIAATARRRGTTASLARPGSRDLARLGRMTTIVGAVLTTGGVVAIIVLVADADSTLFLYVDRSVVALIGLIVLVPTIALVAIGRALTLVAPHLPAVGDGRSEPAHDTDEG